MTLCDSPRQGDLRTILAVLPTNIRQDRVIDQLSDVLTLVVDWIRVAKGRVLRDVDAL